MEVDDSEGVGREVEDYEGEGGDGMSGMVLWTNKWYGIGLEIGLSRGYAIGRCKGGIRWVKLFRLE